MKVTVDNVAEWSKALASGASPKGRGFESLSSHFFARTMSCASVIVVINPLIVLKRVLVKQGLFKWFHREGVQKQAGWRSGSVLGS